MSVGTKAFFIALKTTNPSADFGSLTDLQGFEGKELEITNEKYIPKNLLLELQPRCPACGQVNKVSYKNA